MQTAHKAHPVDLTWPAGGVTRVPYQVFFDPAIHELEQEKLFRGPVWNYVALEAELPNPGDFKATFVGDTPVVVTRDQEEVLHAFVNRCAHRGALVCRELRGNRATHVCVYHQQSYDLKGNLLGVPFRKGIDGKGGYPADFTPSQHSLHKLTVATYNELIFTFLGYEDDDEEMRSIRRKQANLVGPAEYISLEDGHAIELIQQAIVRDKDACSFLEMGGRDVASQDNLVTETAIRGFWHYYRGLIGFN